MRYGKIVFESAIRGVIQKQAQELGFLNIAPHHKGEHLIDNIYVGSVSHGDYRSTITMLAIRHEKDKWHTVWSHTFPHPKDQHVPKEEQNLMPCNAMMGEEELKRPKIFIQVDDFDGDGQPEILFRSITCHIYRAIGPKTKREMSLFNVQPTGPHLAVKILLDEDTGSWSTKSTVQFKDVNEDKHLDIIRSSSTEDSEGVKHQKDTYVYNPTADVYIHQN